MPTILRLTQFVGSQMIFVNPSDFRQLTKVSWKFNKKGALNTKGQMLNNSKWSLRTNGNPAIPGCQPAGTCEIGPREDTSIYTEVSYSVQNKAQFQADLLAHIKNLQLLAADGLADGFAPSQDIKLEAAE